MSKKRSFFRALVAGTVVGTGAVFLLRRGAVEEGPLYNFDLGEDRFAEVGGYRLHFVEAGQGEALILVPGAFSTYRTWRRVMGPLSSRFRVLALDYVGAGDSDKPETGFGYTPAEQAEIIVGLMDELGIERARLMGVSYGGSIVLTTAALYPERIERAVSIEGFASLGGRSTRPAIILLRLVLQFPGAVDLWVAIARSGLITPLLARQMMGEEYANMTPQEQQNLVTELRLNVRQATAGAWRGIYRGLAGGWDYWEGRRIEVPLLQLVGERSPLRRALGPTLDYLRHNTSEARIVEIAGGAHDLQSQKPQVVLRHVLDFLTPEGGMS